MDGTELPSRQQRSPDHSSNLPAQPSKAPTHLPELEHESQIDMDTEETWYLPVIQSPIRRGSIFEAIWKWLKKTGK